MKKIYTLFCAISVCFALLNPQSLHAQTRLADSTALVALYNNNGGANWTNKTNWLSATQPIDTWYGVHATTGGGQVDSVSLPNNNLTDTLISTVNNLTALVKFDVSHNKITGSLPYFSTATLLILDVSFNQLSGPLNYYATPNLQVMHINNNQFSGNINSLNYYANMLVLNASNNGFTGSLPYFQSVNFDSIDVSYNQLSGTINYYPVQNLQYYNISHNQLTGTAAALPFPAKTTYLDASYNLLTGQLPYFTSTSLTHLDLSHNQFSGTMNYSKVPNLIYIDVSYNQLSGAADPIADATSYSGILYIHMSHNNFTTGQYGLPYFNSKTLYDSIDLSYNQLTGPIGYYTFPNCVYYNLSNNQLSGALPNFSGYAANVALDISHNKFTFNELEPAYGSLPTVSTYAPQDTLASLKYVEPTLTTSFAGGTLANNTYAYYRTGNILDGSVTGDSTYKPTATGTYVAEVTNAVVKGLTLYSDSVSVGALPVTFGALTGTLTGNGKTIAAQLQWTTYTESNNNHFDIERSTNTTAWQNAGSVASKAPNGNSSTALKYSFIDNAVPPLATAVYYRLRQVDDDGNSQYSNVIKLNISPNSGNAFSIKVLPNIVAGTFNITLNTTNSQQVAVRIISANGTVVYTKEGVILQPGDNMITINNFEKVAGGIYHIEVIGSNTHSTLGTYKILKN